MAKGIPLMGRGPDGKAKIINVDANGDVEVTLSGTIRETKFVPSFELAAGATYEINMSEETADKVALMVLLRLKTGHAVTVNQQYRVGDYTSSTLMIKEIPLQPLVSQLRVSGVEPIISPGGLSLRITNNSTETQIYEAVYINLYRRVYHAG